MVETFYSGALQGVWKEQINVDNSYDEYRQENLNMLQKFQHMCNVHPAWIGFAKHCIKVNLPKLWSFNSTSFHEESKAQKLKKT